MKLPLSIIIAANNEEDYISHCLDALLAQDALAGAMDVIVVANACTDQTEAIVEGYIGKFAERGSELTCLHREAPGKIGALNAGDAAAKGEVRAYLDADVICDPSLIGQMRTALATPEPIYCTGTLAVAPAKSWVTRRYADFWQQLPFVKGGAVGAGLFATNGAGRQLWGAFPDIISDDTFVRVNFLPSQRIEVPALYHWPMIEGFSGLVKVRRRQNAGVDELLHLHPDLMAHEGKAPLGLSGLLRLALRNPVSFSVYCAVALAVRSKSPETGWTRGR